MAEDPKRRLDSWKEIADYLGREVRTAMRWEKDKHLPIHRVPGGKRQTVFGFTDEIDAWLVSERDSEILTGTSGSGNGNPAARLASGDLEFGIADSGIAESAGSLAGSRPVATGSREIPSNKSRPTAIAATAGILALSLLAIFIVYRLAAPAQRHPSKT